MGQVRAISRFVSGPHGLDRVQQCCVVFSSESRVCAADNVYNGKQCCVILDDSSRKIRAVIECDNVAAEQSVKLIQKVLDECGNICRIREIITDQGVQFWASRRASKGQTRHSFEMFLQEQNVKRILCRVKLSAKQWQSRTMAFQECKKHRKGFKTFNEFIDWTATGQPWKFRFRHARTSVLAEITAVCIRDGWLGTKKQQRKRNKAKFFDDTTVLHTLSMKPAIQILAKFFRDTTKSLSRKLLKGLASEISGCRMSLVQKIII